MFATFRFLTAVAALTVAVAVTSPALTLVMTVLGVANLATVVIDEIESDDA